MGEARVGCPTCGIQVTAARSGRFCGRCGAWLADGPGRPTRAVTTMARVLGPASRWRRRRIAVTVMALGAVIAGAVLGGDVPGRWSGGDAGGAIGTRLTDHGFADPEFADPGFADPDRDDTVELPSDPTQLTDRGGDRDVGGDGDTGGDQPADDGATPRPLDCRPNACAAWSIELPDDADLLPIGDLVVEVGDLHVHGHDAATGDRRWSRELSTVFTGVGPATTASTSAGGSLLLYTRGELALLDPRQGRLAWHVDLGSRWVDRAGRVDDIVVVATTDRLRGRSPPRPTSVIAFDARDGTLLWDERILDVLQPSELPAGLDTASTVGGEQAKVDSRSNLVAPNGVLAVMLERGVVGGIEVASGDTVWERSASDAQRVGSAVVIRAGNGRALLVDGTTGATATDLGDDVAQVVAVGALVVVTTGDERSFVVDGAGRITDRREGRPFGWSATSTDTFLAWRDQEWVLIVRYDAGGDPARSRRLPGRVGSWGTEVALGAHAGSDLVRAVGVDGRTTVAVRTDGPTEPPPNPSVAPSGARLTLIGRTIVARDDGGVTVQAPGGSVRIDGGREVIAVIADGTVVVRGERGLLGVDGDRLGPVTYSEVPGRP